MRGFKKADHALARQQVVDQQCNGNANAGIDHAPDGVTDVRFHGRVEQDNAQHHAARLHSARPVEGLADKNQHNNADEQQHQQQKAVSTLRIEADIQPEQQHAQHAADDGAEETVAAVQPGVAHIAAHAEDGADAGEGGVAADDKIKQRAQRCREGGLDIALTDVKLNVQVAQMHGGCSLYTQIAAQKHSLPIIAHMEKM